jgi:replicative DNA helicase
VSEPANDIRAEQSILGALLHNPASFDDLGGLNAAHFFSPQNALLFITLQDMHVAGEDIDAVTVFAKLRERGELRRIGAPYLSDLLQAFKSIDSVSAYVQIVIDRWKIRTINQLGDRFKQIHDSAGDIPDALGAARRFLDEAEGEPDTPEGFIDLYESWKGWMQVESPAIESPWTELNERIGGGFHRQHLYVIGARSGTGKTVFLSQSALQSAQLKRRVAFFSLELPKEVLMGRMLSAGARIPYRDIVQRSLTSEMKQKLDGWISASGDLQSNLHVDDRCSMTIEDISRKCRGMKRANGIDVIYIDYAQRLKASNSRADREQQVAHIFQGAKTLARETDAAVVLAAQLNREIEREKRLPRKSDFRESGAAEQEADVALILTRAERAAQPLINFTIVKNRLGIEETFQLPERFHYQRLGR